jgi:hypothetical protein
VTTETDAIVVSAVSEYDTGVSVMTPLALPPAHDGGTPAVGHAVDAMPPGKANRKGH